MRPWLNTTVNVGIAGLDAGDNCASMRPWLNTTVNHEGNDPAGRQQHASMRPWLNTTVNRIARSTTLAPFNRLQ